MKFSIIIPLYNKAPYIRKALESVFAQTYTDYELIIVDDGSTDGSAEIVEQLLASPKSSPEGKDFQPTPNSFPKEGESMSFAKAFGAHTADSTQYDLLKENAETNRKNPTEAESVLWDMLRGNKIGYHFRRQHIILDYIVDFICLDKGLVIELDGGYHNDPQQKEYDEQRTAHLQRLGYTELRFKNEELLCNPDSVLQLIKNTLDHLPSLQGGARGRLIRQANAGVSAARNNGVSVSSGDYVAFLDADDWWEPTYLERMAQLIADYPDAGLYACNYVYYKPGKTHVALNIPTGYINYPKAYYESGAMPVTSITAILPRKIFNEIGGFPLGIRLGEDFLLWAQIALRYPVAFLNEPLAWYNNDVPATLRATRNLHSPECHMLFRLDLAMNTENDKAEVHSYSQLPIANRPTNSDWSLLIDKLRISGLLEYWLDKRYHDLAAEELKKVDWNQQTNRVKRIYKTPICLLKLKRWVMHVGSWCKQLLIRR